MEELERDFVENEDIIAQRSRGWLCPDKQQQLLRRPGRRVFDIRLALVKLDTGHIGIDVSSQSVPSTNYFRLAFVIRVRRR
jgi:hypothetical protein